METSPANRLPEADSLPDGFVDSSADHDYKEPPLDVAHPAEPVDARPDFVPATPPPPPAEQGNPRPLPETDRDGDCRNAEKDSAGYEFHTTELKEVHAAENECSENRKLDSSEAKRKGAKRGVKQEKELLEFTFKYQKALAERDSAVAVRERLESLCRELQRQNKMLMDECQRVSTEGQNLRLDLSTKFNDAIKDVSNKLEVQKEECLGQLRDNETLRSKLKHLSDQYALCEQQFAAKLKQKTLELQLADLKLQQQQERSAQEQTQMQLYVEQVTQLLATEKSLRAQLAADGEKFQQFQDALSKSNDVFETFKQEMEKMAKLIKDLKKENTFLKTKCEQSDIALVKLVEEREIMKKQLEKAKNQKEKLESLCRSLQVERKQSTIPPIDNDSVSRQERVGHAEEDS